MTKDDESRRTGRLGQTMPGYSVLAEAFGAAIDGASRMTRTRAKQLAERLLSQAGIDNVDLEEAASEAGARINQLAEEIIAARRANQALLQRTVTTELEKSLSRLGLARADEVASLRAEIAELRRDLAELAVAAAAPAPTGATKRSAAKKTSTARTATAGTGTARTAAGRSPAAKSAAGQTPATKAAARATKKSATARTAKKSAAKKSPAKKVATQKAAPRKASARKTTGNDA
jgi:polyhydroxyalkanoate synthesis regulator phasin